MTYWVLFSDDSIEVFNADDEEEALGIVYSMGDHVVYYGKVADLWKAAI